MAKALDGVEPIVIGLRRLIQAALGEEDMSPIHLPFRLNNVTTFIPVESRRRGYRINRKGRKVSIKRASPWNVFSHPLYCFKGELSENTSGTILDGSLRMVLFPKIMLIVVWSFYFAWLLVVLVFAIALAFKFMIAPATVPMERLATAGFLTGVGLGGGLLLAFVHWFTRVMSSFQRMRMLVFLTATLPGYGIHHPSTVLTDHA